MRRTVDWLSPRVDWSCVEESCVHAIAPVALVEAEIAGAAVDVAARHADATTKRVASFR